MTGEDPDKDARRLSGEALRAGDATGWFERLYAEAADGQAIVPWDRRAPHPLLVEWIEHGLREVERYLGKHALFEDYYAGRERLRECSSCG